MRAHFLSARSISGDSVAQRCPWLFSFQIQALLSSLQLGFQDLLLLRARDYDVFPVPSLVLLLHGLLGPLLRVLPTLRRLRPLALRNVRHARHPASSLNLEEALVECMAGLGLFDQKSAIAVTTPIVTAFKFCISTEKTGS